MSTELTTAINPAQLSPFPSGPVASSYVEQLAARWRVASEIAGVMARASLCPDTLRGEYVGTGNNKRLELYSPDQIVANCTLVTMQALLWEMDPFAVAQCVSIVHGRPMYEGKLVAAAIQHRTGVRLRPVWNEQQGDAMGITITGRLPGEDFDRQVTGTVGMWKTTHFGTPWVPKNFASMLFYRGSREWARIHSPGVILGVYGDDEEIPPAIAPQVTQERPTAAALISTGFKKDSAPEAAQAKPKATKKAAAAAETSAATEPEKAAALSTIAADLSTGAGDTVAETQQQDDAATGDADEIDQRTPEEIAQSLFAEQLHDAKEWADLQRAIDTVRTSGITWTPDQANGFRRAAWIRGNTLADESGEIRTPSDDVEMFRSYLQGTDDADHIKTLWNNTQVGESWAHTSTKAKDILRKAVRDRLEMLEKAPT